ncbi:MAG: hypothetical protein HY360_03080 [Verrucomicrobia bacterium]|nr:hypothetical protein [Verrucomicrobiota bacterium]
MPTSTSFPIPTGFTCVSTVAGLTSLPINAQTDGAIEISFEAPKGLYQFSVIADATEADWDELYVNLHLFGNTGQRTGPWDFNLLDKNAPLVPSYWVELDGQRIGLWFFQRVSMEDIAAKRFRGNTAFYLAAGGRHRLRLVPYRLMKIRWLSAALEKDPDDAFDPRRFDLANWDKRCPAARWAAPEHWADMRRKLDTTHVIFREPLRKAFAWICGKVNENSQAASPPDTLGMKLTHSRIPTKDIILLLAMHGLEGRRDALDAALGVVDDAIVQPHWGNPREDGYGCDGDMGAVHMLWALTWAYHALRDHLGEDRRNRLREKLRLQGARFFNLILLHRDYWGGSIIQDHGKISVAAFGAAAIHLLGILPEAELWVSYIIPRINRNLRALPLDGAIPASSYYCLYLFLDEPTHYRDALLALTGEDIFERASFRKVIDYVITVLREEDHIMAAAACLPVPFIGANAFFNRIAEKFNDGRAAYLQQLLLKTPEIDFYHGTQEHAYYHGALWGFFTCNPAVPPVERLPAPPPLVHFEDSGFVLYRDCRADVTLSLRCGPWCGFNGERHAPGPCDRLEVFSGAGHFTLAIGPHQLLVTPDSGYRLHGGLRSCLLVDGKGPTGDIGYPMSIPSFRYRGEEIQFARWDDETRTGWIRLNLGPAYPEEMQMAFYTRDFLLIEGEKIICRDRVAFSKPHRLAWLFQGRREDGIEAENAGTCRFGKKPWARVAAESAGAELRASVQPTEIVWSYASASGFKPFDHARFESTELVEGATVDFVMTWGK